MPTAGWSGYFRQQFNQAHDLKGKYPTHLIATARALRSGYGGKKTRAAVLALTGSAVGAASKAFSTKRVPTTVTPGSVVGHGGKRVAVTKSFASGNSTANDLATVDNALLARSRPATYPAAKGRGVVGGAMRGFI